MAVLIAVAAVLYTVLFVAGCWLAHAEGAARAGPVRGGAPVSSRGGDEDRGTGLPLPPGGEGHLMAAAALHRATGMYQAWCEDQVRR